MIRQREQYEVTSTVPTANKVAMSIRQEDMPHVMGILTDLYKNKILAMIREYSTNALDAIIAAGKDPLKHPVRITLPGALSPHLTIADSGVGLDALDIREVYSQYGRSTKRDTNTAVGMFGIGCKSALTYTSQFTVTSVKECDLHGPLPQDGTPLGTKRMKVIVAVSREADGSGSMSTVANAPTDEPTGTEVTIAIRREDHLTAETTAREFFKYWTEGSVEVDGVEPDSFEGLAISDTLYVTEGGHGGSKVVMGNVAYPVPELNDLCPAGSVVAFVPIGSCDIPPARESLMDTKATQQTLADIRKRFADGIQVAVQREIDACSHPLDAVRTAIKWDRYVPGGGKFPQQQYGKGGQGSALTGYTFKGGPLPAWIETTDTEQIDRYDNATAKTVKVTVPVPFVLSSNGSYRLGHSREAERLYAVEWPGAVWVKGYTPAKFNANHKKKMQKVVNDRALDNVSTFVCVRGDLPDPAAQPGVNYIEPKRVLDWEEVRKVQLAPRAKPGSYGYRIPGSYDLITESGAKEGVPGDQIRQDVPIFYHHGNAWSARRYAEALMPHYPKFTVVALSQNRIAKFCRIVPTAKTALQALTDKRDEWVKAMSDDDKLALWLADNYIREHLRRLDGGRVKDPALKRGIRLSKRNIDKLQATRKAFDRFVGGRIALGNHVDPLSKYPLIADGIERGADMDHVYAYLNWHHAETK